MTALYSTDPLGKPERSGGAAANTRTPSTTYGWIYGKVRRPAGGQQARRPKGVHFKRLRSWNPREPLSIKVSYRGGAECWVEIHARGAEGRFPGHLPIYEVLRAVWNLEDGGPA